MTKTPPAVRTALMAAMPSVVRDALGAQLFPPTEWHQSLSGKTYTVDPISVDTLRRAGSLISAEAVTVVFTYLVGSGKHLSFQPQGTPKGFRELLVNVKNALNGIFEWDKWNSPHVTASYRSTLGNFRLPIGPVVWNIDKIWLVKGEGNPYAYTELGDWPLRARNDPQLSLPF